MVVVALVTSSTNAGASDGVSRLAHEARASFQFIWRTLRRLGVYPDDAVDDAVQRVFEIAARKADLISPGGERPFLFRTAVLVAAEVRRSARREQQRHCSDESEIASNAPNPEELLEHRERRELLDLALDNLPLELRSVFVLFELEGLHVPEIAALAGIPIGTVASRLKRARERFRDSARRLRLRRTSAGLGRLRSP
jgi:RNA polymerase sigma-70 factor, ECF subfamily